MNKTLLLPLAATLAFAATASAQTIMTFDTREPDTTVGQSSIAAGTGNGGVLDTNLEASSLTFGSGLTSTGTTAALQFVNTGFDSTTLSGALAGNDYLAFTVDAKDGFAASLDNLNLQFLFQNGASSYAWGLYSSIDSYGTAITSETGIAGLIGSYDVDIDLSAIGSLQNISSQVEFRIVIAAPTQWQYAGLADDSSSVWPYTPAVTLSGTTSAVPEPSTYALLAGLLALTSVMVRRRA